MSEQFEKFFAFEKNKNLFSRTYLGVPYWQTIRMAFSGWALWDRKVSTEKHEFSNLLSSGLRAGKDLISDIIKYLFLPKCDILYFDECAYKVIDGKIVDSYFDFFGFEKEYKIQRCFHLYNRQKNTLLNGIGTIIPQLEYQFLQLCLKMKLGNYQDKEEELFLRQLAQDLNKQFHIDISFESIVRMVRKTVAAHKSYRSFYGKILRKCRPKSIIVVAHYSDCLFPLYNIARKYSIPVIELQHGLIVNHDAYWYADTSTVGKELPSYLFTYGEFWNKYIRMPKNTKIVSVGNPFLETRKEKYKNVVPDKKIMVFYSASVVAKEMEQLAIDAWKHFGKKGYIIYFKIHPLDYDKRKKQYKLLSEYPQIRVVSPNQDLYKLLSSAKHHIAYASTVLYEATIFDNNRYLFDTGNFTVNMKPLIDLKLVYKFKTIEELDSMLDKPMGSISNDTLEIWKMDSQKNGLEELRKIMNGKHCKEKR